MRGSLLALLAFAVALPAAEPLAVYGSDRFRVPGEIFSFAVSPNGAFLVARSSDLYVFDAATGRLLRTFEANSLQNGALAIDNQGVVTSCERGGLDGKQLAIVRRGLLELSRWVIPIPRSPELSPNGRVLATFEHDRVILYDTASGEILNQIPGTVPTSGWTPFSGDSRRLMIKTHTETEQCVQIYDCATAGLIFNKAFDVGLVVDLDATGRTLLFWSETHTMLFDVETGALLEKHDNVPGRPATRIITRDRLLEENKTQRTVGLLDLKSKRTTAVDSAIFATAYYMPSPDRTRIISANKHGAIEMYDTATLKRLPQSAEITANVRDLRYTTTGRLVGFAEGWLLFEKGRIQRLGPHCGQSPKGHEKLEDQQILSPDGTRLAWWQGRTVHQIDTNTGSKLWTRDEPSMFPSGPIRTNFCAAFTGNNLLLDDFSGIDTMRPVRSPGEAVKVYPLERVHADKPFRRDASPCGRYVVSRFVSPINAAQTVQIHEIATGRLSFEKTYPRYGIPVAMPRGGARIAINQWEPDGRDFNIVQVLDTATGRRAGYFKIPWSGPAALSDDGRTFAYGVDSTCIELIEVASGRIRGELINTRRAIEAMALAPDGRTVAVAGSDGTVTLWDIATLPKNHVPEKLWRDLASLDAEAGYRAVRGLIAQPVAALTLFRTIAPAAAAHPAFVQRQIASLDAAAFDDRETATKALLKVADQIGPELRRAAAETDSEERRERIAGILAAVENPSGETLRAIRAVEVTEALALAGNADAAKQLRHWATGADGPALTREAKASVSRLP